MKPTKNIWRIKRYLTLLLYSSDCNDKGADQTVLMRRLVCAFVVHNQEKSGYTDDVEAKASWPPPGYAPVLCFIALYALV